MIKICNDRNVFPNSVKVSNQYENDTKSINFDLSDVQFTGNTYLICKYQEQSTFYAPLLLDSNFSIPVETFLSAQPGAYTCVIVISTVTIDADYNFSSDNPLFVSNEFTLNVDPNFLTGTATAWKLTPAAQNYFDQLIALVDKVQEDLDSGAFVGNGIKSITLISTVGLVDTYQILFTDNSTFDFQVTNGATPTITIQDGVWFVNGVSTGVSALGQKGEKGDPGVGIVSVEKTSTSGNVDTYTITFTNQTTSTFTVTNGKNGVTPDIQIGTVTTLPAGSQATATITGTTEKPSLNLGIPEGKTGGTTNYNDLENKPQINGVELKGNKTSGDLKMYTQEEVDYMLADKMDKPYVPITITDNATITNSLEGNFKIDKIKGNTYQNVEENIVPTPNRPVPINSRKTLVTKANPNIFNLEKESDTSNIPDSGTYRSVGQYQLKANTKYIFEWSEATVPAKATLSFQIQDDKGTVLVSPFTYFNLETTEKKETGKQVEFTTNSSGIVKFAYNCTVGTSNTIETYQQYWYTKILKDITLKENATFEPEYIELRSLKETCNLFDLGLLSRTELIETSGSYRKINIPLKLKPNTRYKFYYEKSMIPALSWVVLNIINNTGNIIFTAFNTKNNENNEEVEVTGRSIAFNAPSDGEVYFSYYVQLFNSNGTHIPQSKETFKENWFTKIVKNIMITEDSLNQTTYIPPTVRDYKIVDHANKTSKIIRNVRQRLLTAKDGFYKSGYGGMEISLRDAKPLKMNETTTSFCNLFKHNISNTIPNNLCYRLDSNFLQFNYEGYNDKTLWDKFITDNELYIQYQLANQTEEEITYVENDTSEVGYSWQDTTSPSPTIKSEINGVEEIDILKTGKNLFDLEKAKDIGSWDGGASYKHFTGICFKPNTTYTFSVSKNNMYKYYKAEYNGNFAFYIGETKNEASPNILIGNCGANISNIKNKYTFTTTDKPTYFNLYVKTWDSENMNIVFDELLQNIQLEVGDTATPYEPYQGQRVNIALPQPLYQNDIANVESGKYEYNDITYVLDDKTIKTIYVVTTKKKTQVFQLNVSDFFNNNDIWCDKLKNDSNKDEELFTYKDNNLYIAIDKNRLETSDVAGFKKWLKGNPLTFVGSSSSPATQPIPKEDLAKIKSLKTNAGVNNIFINGEVKPSIEARYPKDLALVQQQLEQKILLISDSLIDTQAKVLLQGGDK